MAEAELAELKNGSRPEEIELAQRRVENATRSVSVVPSAAAPPSEPPEVPPLVWAVGGVIGGLGLAGLGLFLYALGRSHGSGDSASRPASEPAPPAPALKLVDRAKPAGPA